MNNETTYEIYTDGSYKDGKAAWAFIVVVQPQDVICHEEYGMVEDQEAVNKIWNVAGEIEAAKKAIKWAIETDTKITLISDYQGIQGWANDWTTNNQWSSAYSKYAKENVEQISEYRFVKGHSKNKWNDYVDKLAYKQLNSKE
jgi:ribonuclease HI